MRLLNTPFTMWLINGEDRHVKVIKLPSSIMNGTINKADALPFVRRLNGSRAARVEALCVAELLNRKK